MADETLKINNISSDTLDAIKKRSAYSLPDNPSASGMKPSEIKKAFWAPIISEFGSIYTELTRVIKEINTALNSLQGDDRAIAQNLADGLSEAQTNLQSALSSHNSSELSHEDIRGYINDINRLLDEKLKTITSWQNKGSDLPPAYSLLKDLKYSIDILRPLVCDSINNIEYDAEKGDLILYFNDYAPSRVELPLERLVGEGCYDEESRTIRLSLDGGDELVIPVGDLVDEYEGDGETVEVFREGTSRKIKLVDSLKERIDAAYNARHTHENKSVLDSFTQELKESYDKAVDQAEKSYGAVLDATNVYSNAAIGTLTGKSARADDVSLLPHNFNISLKGESAQASEPTLESPVEVVNCENPTLKIFRRNMITTPFKAGRATINGVRFTPSDDGGVVMNGTIGSDFNSPYSFYNTLDRPLTVLRKGVTYRLTCFNGNNVSLRICGKSYATVLSTSLIEHSRTITPDKDITIYRVLGYFDSSKEGVELIDEKIYPMLEIVSDSEGFEAGAVKSVQIPLTLAGQGDYKDEIVVDRNTNTVKHIQKYYKYEFTGEETWSISSSSYSVNTTLARLAVSVGTSTFSSSSYVNYQLCNAVPCVMNYSRDTVGVYATSPSTLSYAQIFARIPTVDATSADFNEVFKSGTYLWYPMANPIETDYTDTEWGQALLALVSDGETLTFDCDAETAISYNKDINKVIQKLTDAIIALGGTI